jgi:hypothetical protein
MHIFIIVNHTAAQRYIKFLSYREFLWLLQHRERRKAFHNFLFLFFVTKAEV